MKRFFVLLVLSFVPFCSPASAEEPVTSTADTTTAAPMTMPEAVPTPVAAEPAATPAETAQPTDAALDPENLEFVSGEVASLDETEKSVTVKLYGETENAPSDKTLKVTTDENTDITDGEQDRELKSLTPGTEVDVEYDPSNNKATYIFVY